NHKYSEYGRSESPKACKPTKDFLRFFISDSIPLGPKNMTLLYPCISGLEPVILRTITLILINEIGWLKEPCRELLVNVQKKVLLVIWMLAKPEIFLAYSDRFGLAPSTGHYIYREIINIICSMVDDFIVWPTSRQCDKNAKVLERKLCTLLCNLLWQTVYYWPLQKG
ncbi:unnamed protein product, partial [Callosobruchus maculatus]